MPEQPHTYIGQTPSESLLAFAAEDPAAAFSQCQRELASAEQDVRDLRATRAKIIAMWREDGTTLELIGVAQGVTRQTVHQWSSYR